MDQKTILEYIRCLEHMTAFMRSLLDEEKKLPVRPETEWDRLAEYTELRLAAKSDVWPQAVPEDMICADDEENKLARAAGIINDFIHEDLTGKKFLDYGCGEGHTAYVASNLVGAKLAIGYDSQPYNWKQYLGEPGLLFMTKWQYVKEQGPYDIILVNDVLDHSTNPRLILEQLRDVKTPETGKVYMRCHPWASRHGTHLYKQLNRAYLHLVFTPEELVNMGLKETPAVPIYNPLETYRELIQDTGFKVLKEDLITHPVEMFFTHRPAVLRRIKERFANSKNPAHASGEEFPRDVLEVQFVDYILA
jgi:2-polyprenyl-3-methyl-5-hydroxy-6-metoxy-1,4-benzoquinol methylase